MVQTTESFGFVVLMIQDAWLILLSRNYTAFTVDHVTIISLYIISPYRLCPLYININHLANHLYLPQSRIAHPIKVAAWLFHRASKCGHGFLAQVYGCGNDGCTKEASFT